MKKRILTTYAVFALGAWTLLPMATAEAQDGPVRRGLRNAAEGTAEAARRGGEAARDVAGGVAQGTAQAARRTGEAARNAAGGVVEGARRTGEAARNVAGGVAEGAAEAARRTGEAARNLGQGARDAVRGANRNSNQYRGEYGAGYRGPADASGDGTEQPTLDGDGADSTYVQDHGSAWSQSGASSAAGRCAYTLRHDACGREFICVNGQRVYFDNQSSEQVATKSDGATEYTTRKPDQTQWNGDADAPASPDGQTEGAEGAAAADSDDSPQLADPSANNDRSTDPADGESASDSGNTAPAEDASGELGNETDAQLQRDNAEGLDEGNAEGALNDAADQS